MLLSLVSSRGLDHKYHVWGSNHMSKVLLCFLCFWVVLLICVFVLEVGTLSSFKLNVSHNSLQKLEQNSTTGRGSEVSVLHSNVKVLDLSYNNVTRIGRTFFKPVERSLSHLHLSHNWVRNATREVFGNMPHLQWLDLSYNQLVDMDFDTFRNTRNLQVRKSLTMLTLRQPYN